MIARTTQLKAQGAYFLSLFRETLESLANNGGKSILNFELYPNTVITFL